MKKIHDQLWAVAKEYARLFGEVIGIAPEYWVSDVVDICCFGDAYYFTLNEMQVVVDNLDEYVSRYGSKEAVGDEVRDWVDWWLEGSSGGLVSFSEERVTHQLRPNISLAAWLAGCPHDGVGAWEGADADYFRHEQAVESLEWLVSEFRENRTLWNVLDNVRSKLKILKEQRFSRIASEVSRLKSEK